MALGQPSSARARRSAGRSSEPAPPLRSRAWRQTCASGEGPKCRATLSVMTTSARDLSTRLAELIERCPEVVEPLRAGHLCLTSIVELAKVLTPENRDEVLPRFFHASKTEAKAVSAELQPESAPPRRDVVTHVRASPLVPDLGHPPLEQQRCDVSSR